VRWGLAIGAVYWYNTSPLFADGEAPRTGPAPPQFADSELPTVEAVVEEKRWQAEAKASKAAPPPPVEQASSVPEESSGHAQSPEESEEETGHLGAVDPDTGEINWDCPCLGGMAHGPCGEEFKAAFSCFVHSQEDPKGMDCIGKFQHMQDCFRKYPEVYGAELADEDDDEAPAAVEGAEGEAPARQGPQAASEPSPEKHEAAETAAAEASVSQPVRSDVAQDAEPSTRPREAPPKPAGK